MKTTQDQPLSVQPVGVVRSCFREKFGVPRQGGLVPSAVSEIVLLPPFNRREWVDGLEHSTHIWVMFWFHLNETHSGKSSVRPPRMGGNERMGVFATRSMFRPNPIGLSALELLSIYEVDDGISLRVRGADMVDGTPVIDIKPYVPYCDSIASARCDWAQQAPPSIEVEFEAGIAALVDEIERVHGLPLRNVVTEMIAQDPRPAFHRDDAGRIYGARLWQWNVRWTYVVAESVVAASVVAASGAVAARVIAIEEMPLKEMPSRQSD